RRNAAGIVWNDSAADKRGRVGGSFRGGSGRAARTKQTGPAVEPGPYTPNEDSDLERPQSARRAVASRAVVMRTGRAEVGTAARAVAPGKHVAPRAGRSEER